MSQVVDTSAQVAQARQQLQKIVRSYALRQLPVALPFLIIGQEAGFLAFVAWPKSLIFSVPFIVLAGALVWFSGFIWWGMWQRRSTEVLRELNQRYPELEDSVWLLSQSDYELSFLGQLQQRRVAQRLLKLLETQRPLLPINLKNSWIVTACALAVSAFGWWAHANRSITHPTGVAIHFSAPGGPAKLSKAPARILETQLLVTPPAYTRQPAFAPAQASFQCPQEARVRWQVRVSNSPQPAAPMLELGRQTVRLRPVGGRASWFFTEQILNVSTLYRLRYAGTVSDDYAIDVRPDQAPVLRIITPKSYTLVAAIGQRPEVPIRATVRDDYGLSRAELVITVAQGQGEAVKFHEVRRDLSAGLGGVQANLSSQLNLPKLGLTYGDELYFYLTARDNHGHTTRTDSYLVQWQDTAVADSSPSLGMGVKVAPAYFRSQRQIIIDTEKLIAEKSKLDAATVASRANSLGFDQQTLRLRYGKFLGEEMEAGMGVTEQHAPTAEDDAAPASPTAEAPDEHDHAAPPASAAKASLTAETDALMEPYVHHHDDAETADFLEPAVKAKLHAVLDQMWASELRLRTGQLKAALPYEYRALRLLKEVQQQTRAFVKKAGFTPPPMPEATLRLTGELAGAAVPHRQQMLPAPADQPTVRATLRWLATSQNGQSSRPADAVLLDQAGAVLAAAALEQPGAYLPALRALRQLVSEVRAGQPTCAVCRPPVVRALTNVLPPAPPTPFAAPAAGRLAHRYFQQLNR